MSFAVADSKPTFWDRAEAGSWEPATLAALTLLIRPGTTFLDVGAWVGPVTLVAAWLGASVVAIEPDPAARAELEANVAANPALAGHIRIIDGALSAHPGTARLGARRKPGDSMSSSLLAGAPSSWDARAVTPSELDTLVAGAGDLVVKMDIEGGEYAALPALADFFTARKPVLLLSLHPAILRESGERDVETISRHALSPFSDWQFFALDGAQPILRPDRAGSDEWLLLPPGRVLQHGGSV